MTTLEDIKAEHDRLGQLIAQLSTQAQTPAPTLFCVEGVEIELQPGERYAGLVLDEQGQPDYHLILLPGEATDVKWKDAVTAAAGMGGTLPTRQEQALLYANLKSEFKPTWYWSSEEHTDGSFAWLQDFYDGLQVNGPKSYAGLARAVRRFTA